MNFATLDLNLLRVLDGILRHGSTVAAGRGLGLSQSAVSGALGRLRHALDDELFIRHGNRLVPTDFALALAAPLREELERLEALLAPADFDPAVAAGGFRIAASDFFAEMLMPALGDNLLNTAPGVCAQLIDLVPGSHVDSLERYRADLALIPHETFPDWIEFTPLFHSSFHVIARRDHSDLVGIAPGDTLPMDLFCAIGHVVFSPQGNLAAMGDAALARVGRSRHVAMTLPVFSGVCRVVSGSDLIALVPRQLAEHVAPMFGLVTFLPPLEIAPALIVGAWHRRSRANPLHAWMRAQVFDLLRPLNRGETSLSK